MKRTFIFACALLMASIASAITLTELSDSLTLYANQKAFVGPVHVSNFRVARNTVTIYTDRTLACLSLSPEEIKDLRLQVSQWVVGSSKAKVKIYCEKNEIGQLITTRFQPRDKSQLYKVATAQHALVTNASQPYTIKQGLDGKHIALWGSHGIYYVQKQQTWKWQRARLWTTVEDLYTSSYTMPFLVPMLENAGAIVIQPRERDTQLNEVIVDDAQLSGQSGLTPAQDGSGWGKKDAPLLEGENPFTMGNYSIVQTQATYTPSIPQAGEYAVYVSYKSLPNSNPQAQYTIVHQGVKTTYNINQQMGGGTWIYVGTFAFGTDQANNYVTITHQGKNITTTDAIKFGGGWGSVARYPHPGTIPNVPSSQNAKVDPNPIIDSTQLLKNIELATTSGYPRYIEGARYWLQYAGIPDSVYNYTLGKNDYTDDYASRGRWVNWLAGGSAAYREGPGLNIPINMSLAFHSDAGATPNDTLIGTLVIYTDYDDDKQTTFPSGGSRICNRDMADFIQTQIVEDIQHTLAPNWPRRRLYPSSYAESRNPKVPSILIELLSHQNYADMKYGLDPKFKFVVSRAIYKGMLRFMHQCAGTNFVVQPLPVQDMKLSYLNQDNITLSWNERVDQLEPSAKPTYYVLYQRKSQYTNGQWIESDWDNGTIIAQNHTNITLQRGVKYDFMIKAGNNGGVSMPSEVLSAYLDKAHTNQLALIINGFDRVDAPEMFGIDSITGGIVPGTYAISYGKEISFLGEQFDYDRTNDWNNDDDCGFGMCKSDKQKEVNYGNTFDYPSMHGKVLAQMGISYISTSANTVDSLTQYALVDVIMGKQKGNAADATGCIPQNLKSALAQYTQQGGKVLLTGSYIASQMLAPADTAWTSQVMHYTYKTEKASNNGKINMHYNILTNQQYDIYTTPNPHTIECENPDGIEPTYGAKRLGRYDDTNVCAGIAYDHPTTKIIVLPFSIESVKQFDTLYQDCIHWLYK